MSESYGEPTLQPLSRDEATVLRARAVAARAGAADAAARLAAVAPRSLERARASESAILESERALARLHATVAEYAALLRRLNTPPGRALLMVKEAVLIPGIPVGWQSRELHDHMVSWFVEAYFAA